MGERQFEQKFCGQNSHSRLTDGRPPSPPDSDELSRLCRRCRVPSILAMEGRKKKHTGNTQEHKTTGGMKQL